MLKNKLSILILLLLIVIGDAQAQKSETYSEANADFRNGVELFDKEKFGAAREQFETVLERIADPNDEIRVNAEYYHALCALELFNMDAEHLLREFIRHHPESPRVQSAYFQLGRYYYRRKKFDDALEWFDKVDEYKLDNKELAEFYFKKGYSHFREGNLEKADKYFYQIREADSEYQAPALYFHSHIQYEKKNYQTALDGFMQLRDHDGFGKIVPIYIAQIYYLQKKYDEVIAYASPLIDTAKVKREAEISRMIGESHFAKDEFAKAIPRLEAYQNGTHAITRDDSYQLGYAYYKTGNYEMAMQAFNKVTTIKDPMAQLAYYHIADCFLKGGDKTSSRAAFREASKLEFDGEIKENALYNYAKLSYELAYNPYHEAIKAFEEYLETYPNSPRKEEAYNYLIDVYMTTNNYNKALESLDKIQNKNIRQQTAYQLVAFNAGVELYGKQQFTEAIASFQKVKTFPIDRDITNRSIYWTGEAYYSLEEYENAIVQYRKFQAMPEAILNEFYHTASYNIGYAYVKKKQYDSAITEFRRYTTNYADEDKKKLNDAFLRIGDGYFVQRNYVDAMHYYKQAIEIRLINTDYAMYQTALCMGYSGDKTGKIKQLLALVNDYPDSPQLLKGKFELATTYRLNGEKQKAMTYYNQVVTEYPNSPLVKTALVQIGLLQYQSGRTNDAIATLKRVANESSSLPEAKSALANLKSIYADIGDPQGYIAFIQTLPYYNSNPQELDTLHFDAGKELYFATKYGEAVSAFDLYLTKFTKPIFEVDARYYRAMSNYQLGNMTKALPDLDFIIGLPSNIFTEDALLLSSRLHYENKNYQSALANYMSLEKVTQLGDRVAEAQVGQMRCFFRLNNCSAARDYAEKVINNDNSDAEIRAEANMIKGQCDFKENMLPQAFKSFEKVAKATNREIGSEAQYYMALIYHKQGKYDRSDKEVSKILKRVPSHDHWIAMSFLVLAENAIAIEDYFQAKATLQSIIDHHDGADVVRKAQERLDWIIAQEGGSEGGEKRNDNFDVEMDGFVPGQEKLFEDDVPKPPKEKRKGSGDDNDAPTPEEN